MWRISRRRQPASDRDQPAPLVEWLSQDFAAWSGNLRGSQAAVEVLLPIADVAFGLRIFALVLRLTVGA